MILEKLTIDRKSGEAVSNQIAKCLRMQIANKEIMPGDKLPTTVEVVKFAGIGGYTFRKAINKLEKEGLVESIRRRGTFVKSADVEGTPLEQPHNSSLYKKGKRNLRLAIMSTVSPVMEGQSLESIKHRDTLYRPETTAGILKECEVLGIFALVVPSNLREAAAEDVYQMLRDNSCDGVIWPSPINSEWNTIEHLTSRSVAVMVTSRSRLNVNCACVETDYEQAGFAAGEHLIKSGYKSVLLLTHFSESSSQKSNLPYGIRQGIARALEQNGLDPSNSIKIEECVQIETIGKKAVACLEKLSKETGPVFTNAFQLLDLLKNDEQRAHQLLDGREFVVLSNNVASIQLAPFMGGLDPMVLIDPFETVGRLAVQKVLSVIEGYLSDTITLAKIRFERFSNLGLSSKNLMHV